jgi:hypothetical protein
MATLLAEIYGPDADTRRKTAVEVEKIFRSVPYIVDVDNSFGSRARRCGWCPTAPDRSLRPVRTAAVRQHRRAAGQPDRRLCPARAMTAIRCRSTIALPQSQRILVASLAATPVAATPGGNWSNWANWSGAHEAGQQPFSAATGAGGHGHWLNWPGAMKRRSMACWRSTRDRRVRLEGARAGPSPRSALTASPPTKQDLAAVGRRMGNHLGHLPRHGRGLHGGAAGHLCPGRRPVPQLQAAAGDPDADPADLVGIVLGHCCSARRSPRPR